MIYKKIFQAGIALAVCRALACQVSADLYPAPVLADEVQGTTPAFPDRIGTNMIERQKREREGQQTTWQASRRSRPRHHAAGLTR